MYNFSRGCPLTKLRDQKKIQPTLRNQHFTLALIECLYCVSGAILSHHIHLSVTTFGIHQN